MNKITFVQTTIGDLETELFNELRDILTDEFIPLSVIRKEEITVAVLEELVCNYFDKIEFKTGKEFEKIIDKFTADLDSIVGNRIAETPKTRKNQPTPEIPRARKYYEKASELRKINRETKRGLIDYTRLMLCLYTAIMNNGYKSIKDFDYSFSCINLSKIIASMRKETTVFGKARFDTKDPYDSMFIYNVQK